MHVITRQRLLDVIIGDARPITIITGGPATGKTVLASQCCAALVDSVTVWVHLDAGDDFAERFWLVVGTALARAVPAAFPETAVSAIDAATDPTVHATSLLAAASTLTQPVVVVLDDLHVITDPAIHDELGLLGDGLPPQMRLLITSRSDPHLPVGRWQVRSRMTEVRGSALEFTAAEALALVRECGENRLTPSEVEELRIGTAGWVGALRLAVLAMSDHDDPATVARTFTGQNRMVADLLITEVLERQPADVQDFLLCISLVAEVDPDLAAALTGRDDSASLLNSLVAQTGFISSSADDCHYRCHPMLKDVLRVEFDRRFSSDAIDRRRAAADVAASHGATLDAVALLLDVGDTDRAFEIVIANAFARWDQNNLAATRAWIDHFPREYVTETVSRMLQYCEALGFVGRLDESVVWLDLACQRMEQSDEAVFRDLRHADALRLLTYGTNATLPNGIEAGERALAAIDDGLQLGIIGTRVGPHLTRAYLLNDMHESARTTLNRCVGDGLTESVLVPALRSWVALRDGSLVDALDLAQRARTAAQVLGHERHLGNLDAMSTIAGVMIERNQTLEASEMIEQMREITELHPRALLYDVIRCMNENRLAVAVDGPEAGLDRLQEIRDTVPRSNRAQLRFVVDAFEARWRIETHDYRRAEELLTTIGPGAIGTLLAARLDLAHGRADAAIRRLADADLNTLRDRISAELLCALADHARDGDSWRAHVARAVELAAPQRFVRIFVDEGALITRAARVAAECLHDEDGAYLASSLGGAPARTFPASLATSLTTREEVVLRLLPSTLTNREIGAQLFMSVNTVKTHLKSIYLKLDVTTRAEAVARARALGLLPRRADSARSAAGRVS